jgi:hypothetical protein
MHVSYYIFIASFHYYVRPFSLYAFNFRVKKIKKFISTQFSHEHAHAV